MPQVILYAEHCQGKAGRAVPMPREGEIDLECPDYQVWQGSAEELVDSALELIDRQSGSSYHLRSGQAILESINRKVAYVCRNDCGLFMSGSDDDGEPTYDDDIVNAEQHGTRAEAEQYAVDGCTIERHVASA